MDTKDTNPKDALGIKKAPLHCVPTQPLFELGLAMMEGGRKYGTHNYRAIGVRASTYYNATLRHLMDWWEGEDIDADSNVDHVVKAIACLFVLRDSIIGGNCEDDRPLKHPEGLDLQRLNKIAGNIIDKYPECVEPYTEANKERAKQPVPVPDTSAQNCDTCLYDTNNPIEVCATCQGWEPKTSEAPPEPERNCISCKYDNTDKGCLPLSGPCGAYNNFSFWEPEDAQENKMAERKGCSPKTIRRAACKWGIGSVDEASPCSVCHQGNAWRKA